MKIEDRFNAVKEELKTVLGNYFYGVYVEGSKVSSILNVLAYHFSLMEGKLNYLYQNQYLDSITNETDLISLCNSIGIRRKSMIPNYAVIDRPAFLNTQNRSTRFETTKNGIKYYFYYLKPAGTTAYEGSYKTYPNKTITNADKVYYLTESSKMFVHEDSLLIKLTRSSNNSLVTLKMCTQADHIGNPDYYNVYENSDGNYTIEVFDTGSLQVNVFMVGSPNSDMIEYFLHYHSSTITDGYYAYSDGYSEKESIEDFKSSVKQIFNSNNRAITISDYNAMAYKLRPEYKLRFYDENDPGVVYYTNLTSSTLTTPVQNEISLLFKDSLAIPGVQLTYKKVSPTNWIFTLNCLVKDLTLQGDITTVVTNYFSNKLNNVSLLKLMQELYEDKRFSSNIVDLKVTSSVLEYSINQKDFFDLSRLDPNVEIALVPYMSYSVVDNEIQFDSTYTGKLRVQNTLSSLTFTKNDYITFTPEITFTTI